MFVICSLVDGPLLMWFAYIITISPTFTSTVKWSFQDNWNAYTLSSSVGIPAVCSLKKKCKRLSPLLPCILLSTLEEVSIHFFWLSVQMFVFLLLGIKKEVRRRGFWFSLNKNVSASCIYEAVYSSLCFKILFHKQRLLGLLEYC